jgi:hypothetical protein
MIDPGALETKTRTWLDGVLSEYRSASEQHRGDLRALRDLVERFETEVNLHVPGSMNYDPADPTSHIGDGMVRGMVVKRYVWLDYHPQFQALRAQLDAQARPLVAVAWSGKVRFPAVVETMDALPPTAEVIGALRAGAVVLDELEPGIPLEDELARLANLDEEGELAALVYYDEDERAVFLRGAKGLRVLAANACVAWDPSADLHGEVRFDLSRAPTEKERPKLVRLAVVAWTETAWADRRSDLTYRPDDQLANEPYRVEYRLDAAELRD